MPRLTRENKSMLVAELGRIEIQLGNQTEFLGAFLSQVEVVTSLIRAKSQVRQARFKIEESEE